MPVISNNSSARPAPQLGVSVQTGNYSNGPYANPYYGPYFSQASVAHKLGSVTSLEQVVGFVPVFPCDGTECRLGKYGSNDTEFMLPAFAQNQTSRYGDYFNDTNSWLFNVPAASGLINLGYFLDKKVSGSWVEQEQLDDNKYGFFYPVGKLCDKNYWTGFEILWNLVLNQLGEGVYRFRVSSSSGSFKTSVNHLKIVGYKPGGTPSISLNSTGFGLICPTYYLDPLLTFDDNMINLTAFINTYQTDTYPNPLFRATFNATTHMIDLEGLLGQNCACTASFYDVTVSNYAQQFTTGVNTYVSYGCWASPPFCLKTLECWAVDRTTRFDASYSGGIIGNIDKSRPGATWSFCCSGRPVVYPEIKSLFTLQFWQNGVIYESTTFTFTPDMGYDLVPPVTFTPGTTPAQCATQLAAAINAYQATLGTPQFNAVVPAYAPRRVDITNLFGQNITMTINYTDKDPVPSGNTIQLTLNSLITYNPPTYTGGGAFYYNIIGQFNGGANINPNAANVVTAISWRDSIRVGGEFGYENTDFERKSIKYQTGVVNKIRDEVLLKHTWKSTSLPFWFHERFKGYGLTADILKVSDYNMNNADYNIKLYEVQGDSSYNPEYKGFPRETQVKCDFRPRTQNLKRTRCC